jgi:hypothetical protein
MEAPFVHMALAFLLSAGVAFLTNRFVWGVLVGILSAFFFMFSAQLGA